MTQFGSDRPAMQVNDPFHPSPRGEIHHCTVTP
jgi:hypothetical protein